MAKKFAVIKTGGKQYIVTEGQTLKIEKIAGKTGDKIEFKEVLLVADDEGKVFDLGAPTVKNIVKAVIVEQGRAEKISVVKYKPKVRYRRRVGHRQPFTKVKIEAIG